MGSLRNPIGPLPSSIYWRRRAVALSLIVLLALLIVWAVNYGDTGGSGDRAKGPDGKEPATSITPGPTESGPAISQRPGGRDESGAGDGTASGGAGDDGTSAGDGSANGASAGAGQGAAEGAGGTVGGLPAGASLPECTSANVRLTLRSAKNSYDPGEKPTFELIVKNTGTRACAMDVGAKAAVLTITTTDGDDRVWASADCPPDDGHELLRVPAQDTASHPVTWDRRPSEPHCATPSARSAKPGTYLVEANAKGWATARVSFVLAED